MRFLAQLDADASRRHALSSGQSVVQQAVEAGLITHDEHSMTSLAQAVDQLVSEEAVKLVDDYAERRRPGEALSPSRFYNCRDIEITLRGHEVIENLKLLAPIVGPTPDAPAEPGTAGAERRRRGKKFLQRRGERFARCGELGSGLLRSTRGQCRRTPSPVATGVDASVDGRDRAAEVGGDLARKL